MEGDSYGATQEDPQLNHRAACPASMTPTNQTDLQPGFLAFHSNRSEDLAEVVINWMRRHPLSPLEEEIVLVQSNGMAEWVKMELARMGGV